MEPRSVVHSSPGAGAPEWAAIAGSPEFIRFRRARRRLALACLVPFAALFFALPIMTATTEVLSEPVAGSLTWAYLWAFALFVVGWIVSGIYGRRAARLDALAIDAVHSVGDQR